MFQFVCRIQFKCECRTTLPGDSLIVVGDHPKLGNWDVGKGLPLSTTDEAFPMWSSPVLLFVFVGLGMSFIEYKYVIQKCNGRVVSLISLCLSLNWTIVLC